MNPHFGLPGRKKDQQEELTDQNQMTQQQAYPARDQGENTFVPPAPGALPPYGPSVQMPPNQQTARRQVDDTAGRPAFNEAQTELFHVPTNPLRGPAQVPPSYLSSFSSMPPQPPQKPKRNPLVIGIIAVVLVVTLVGGGGWALMNSLASQNTQVNKPVPTPTKPVSITPTPRLSPVSPLLFGTNLELYDSKDQVLTSAKTRQLFQQINMRIIRMPMREDGTLEPEIQGARAIKELGATPLVILHGDARVGTALQDDTRMIQEMNKIFGNSLVYYEYGNEQDLHGIGAAKYTDSWNRVVPQLKKIATNAHFIGPVNYEYNRDYLQYFLKNASPQPEEVSWHEYTCDKSWAKEKCLSNIDNWSKHIGNARAMMKETVGKDLPIMITEWNYAPNPTLNDGKISDQTFMTNWTTKAFQVLAANRIFATMIYAGTHPIFPLVAHNETLSTQGDVFKREYQTIITDGKAPAALNGADTNNQTTSNTEETGNENVVFAFENGQTNRWTADHSSISRISTGSVARNGNSSLQVSIAKLNQGEAPAVFANVSGDNPPHAGQSVAGYVYVSSNAISLSARMVVIDQSGKAHEGEVISLMPGKWNRVALTLPADFSGQAQRVGIRFSSPGDNVTGADAYIDDIGWK